MKKLVDLFFVILLINTLPVSAMTSGEADGEDHPNVGLMIADIDGEPQWRCSGTLIAPRVFLTAGHCVGDGATAARVWFETDIESVPDYPDGGIVAIEGTPIPHPDYTWGVADPHYVGVVILHEAVDYIEPATLTDPGLLTELKEEGILHGGYCDSLYFTFVGYGGALESWPPPLLDYEDVIRQVAESEYVALSRVYLHTSQKAVFDEEGTCFGDSGGPAFLQDNQGQEILVALTSTGDTQCVAVGFNYRIDIPDILDWIKAQYPE